jgi:hypothetical protein
MLTRVRRVPRSLRFATPLAIVAMGAASLSAPSAQAAHQSYGWTCANIHNVCVLEISAAHPYYYLSGNDNEDQLLGCLIRSYSNYNHSASAYGTGACHVGIEGNQNEFADVNTVDGSPNGEWLGALIYWCNSSGCS